MENNGSGKFDLRQMSLKDLTACAASLHELAQGAGSMEEVADRLVDFLYQHLWDAESGGHACALVRFYKTHAYGDLPGELQEFARNLMPEEEISDTTKCLTLLATRGEKAEWCSRQGSQGHKAIPLPSEEVVDSIPMIRSLIRQFGLDVNTIVSPDPRLILDLHEKQYNVFYVPEALGSEYIPAQEEFVRPYNVKSALGFGGLLPSGDMFAAILFAKTPVSAETAELFRNLSMSLKLIVQPFEDAVFA